MRNILLYEATSVAKPDYLLFLGDGLGDFEQLTYCGDFAHLPSLGVRGNCDFFGRGDAPELREVALANVPIMMMHGHRFEVKSGTDRAAAFAASKQKALLLFGHTHVQAEKRYAVGDTVGGAVVETPLVLFNPGSVASGCYGVITLSAQGVFCEAKCR